MPATDTPVPYETLVRFGVVQRRIKDLAVELYRLDEQLGHWIGDQLGHGLPDYAYDEFGADVDARLAEEDDAS